MASATTSVQASVLHGAKDLRIESRSLPAPAANELQISIHSTGLCGSDLHYYTHNRNGDILVREPLTLGHESSGTVVAVGSSVNNNTAGGAGDGEGFQIGDRVALEVGVPCDECDTCASGRYNICAGMRFRSSAKSFPHFQGTLQQRLNHPAKWCYKLPRSVGMEVGALLEPLGVALHAFRRSCGVPQGGKAHERVLVFGAGAVGLLCAAVAKVKGAREVVIADIDAGRVQFAVDRGFADRAYTVPMKRGKDVEEGLAIARETAAEVGKLVDGQGKEIGLVDVVFECTGVQACVQAGIYATKPGGRVMLVGMGNPIQTLALSAAALREVDLVGVFRYANTYAESIEIVSRKAPGDPDFASLVTHKFSGLDNAVKAFEMAGKTKDEDGKLVLKVVIETAEDVKV